MILAIENRYYFREIPDFDEIGIILEEFRGGNVRYRHDVGDAVVQERLGMCRQRELLIAYADALVGIHLHDIKGLDDHFAPGQGEIRFEEISPFYKPHMTRILEIRPKVTKEELKKIPPIDE